MVKLPRRWLDIEKVSSTILAPSLMHISLLRCAWKDLKEQTLFVVTCIWNILEFNKYLFRTDSWHNLQGIHPLQTVVAGHPRMLVCKSAVFIICNFCNSWANIIICVFVDVLPIQIIISIAFGKIIILNGNGSCLRNS